MADKLYSIKESTLTDIGDALRRRHGETEVVVITENILVPVTAISKTPAATGHDSVGYVTGSRYNAYNVVEIKPASSLKIIVTSIRDGYIDQIKMAEGIHDATTFPTSTAINLMSKATRKEYIINSNAVTIYADLTPTNNYERGYYAEIIGLDENGNELPVDTFIEAEVEKEVKNTYKSSEIAQAIDNIDVGANIPEEAFVFTGNCQYKFNNGSWDWFLEQYGDKITTVDITSAQYMFANSNIEELNFYLNFKQGANICSYMFYGCRKLRSIPSIDFKHNNYTDCNYLFSSCEKTTEIGDVKNLYPAGMSSFFSNCYNLRTLPNFINLNLSRIQTYAYCSFSGLFSGCYSLRSIPEEFLKQIYGVCTSASYPIMASGFAYC